jgi:hypothetical protein
VIDIKRKNSSGEGHLKNPSVSEWTPNPLNISEDAPDTSGVKLDN